MKKILFAVLFFTFLKSHSQSLDGITVNLTIRSTDWAFLVGKLNSQNLQDSVSLQRVRRLRDTILLANPSTWNTNVRFNSIPAKLVYNFYVTVKTLPVTLYERVGPNIDTQIKAIPNATLQAAITAFDLQALPEYQFIRNLGKNIVTDN